MDPGMKPAGPPVLHGEAEGGEHRMGWGPWGVSGSDGGRGTPPLSCPQPLGHTNLPPVGQHSSGHSRAAPLASH